MKKFCSILLAVSLSIFLYVSAYAEFAVFTSESDAQGYADSIQSYLVVNRTGYNAMKWADPQKHYNKNLWAIPLPPENVDIPQGATLQENLNGWVDNTGKF